MRAVVKLSSEANYNKSPYFYSINNSKQLLLFRDMPVLEQEFQSIDTYFSQFSNGDNETKRWNLRSALCHIDYAFTSRCSLTGVTNGKLYHYSDGESMIRFRSNLYEDYVGASLKAKRALTCYWLFMDL